MYDVQVRSPAGWRPLARRAREAARAALEHQGAGDGAVTIVLVDEPEMARMHREFAAEDGPTDVLSFPDGSVGPEGGLPYYGDVIVCVPVALRQAQAAGHTVEEEVRLLTVHGILHLLGYDHQRSKERERMWRAQASILGPGAESGESLAEGNRRARSRIASFGHAAAGWWYVLRTQRNAWIHAAASLAVLALAAWLGLPAKDWALLIGAIALVWMAEFLNTALEAVVDLASPEVHPLGRVGKDVGAAAVLIAAAAAAVVGLLVLGPPLVERLVVRP